MHCPACGHDRIRIIGSPQRFADYDDRDAVCEKCHRTLTTRTTITAIHVVDPETLSYEEIPPDRFTEAYRDHCLGRAPHPRRRGRLDA
jgi:transcriptional regulator NrdR family protein